MTDNAPAPAATANEPGTRAVSLERDLPAGITEHSARVNGAAINYKIAGGGPVIVLLHGYAQTSHMWLPLMPTLATSHTFFRAFGQDAKDFAGFAATKLDMPFLVVAGEKASGTFLIEQARLVATKVEGQVIPGAGHWLMEEAPQQVMPAITAFLK